VGCIFNSVGLIITREIPSIKSCDVFLMLATQMLLVVMTVPWLTVAIGVRACFRKLIGNFCPRHCLDLNMSFGKAIFQKYYQPVKNSHNLS
jgi:hypothetical protein